MPLNIAPSEQFYYRYDGVEGTEPIYEIPDDPTSPIVISLEQTSNEISMTTNKLSKDYEAYIFAQFPTGFNIASEKQIWVNVRTSEVPSQFDCFELYLEDGNRRTAHMCIDDEDIGYKKMLFLSALIKDKGFNPTFIKYIGIHFKGHKDDEIEDYTLVIEGLSVTTSPVPHYCQPQEVIDFIGMTTNSGSRYILTDDTPLSYNAVAEIICQAENYIEMSTRTAWTERRAVNEIRNISSSSLNTSSSPYMGLFQPSTYFTPSTAYFRGYWVQLVHKNIKDLDKSKGDKLEIRWMGPQWQDITPSHADDKSEVWADNDKGGLYIRRFYVQKDASIRVTYRYGLDEVPEDIKRACVLYTAKHILQTSQLYRFLFPEAGEFEDRWQRVAVSFQYELDRILKARSDQTVIGGI